MRTHIAAVSCLYTKPSNHRSCSYRALAGCVSIHRFLRTIISLLPREDARAGSPREGGRMIEIGFRITGVRIPAKIGSRDKGVRREGEPGERYRDAARDNGCCVLLPCPPLSPPGLRCIVSAIAIIILAVAAPAAYIDAQAGSHTCLFVRTCILTRGAERGGEGGRGVKGGESAS